MFILNIILQTFKILLLLGILVIIHEGGHFIVAKFFKIPVKEFAVGFGKKIWSKEKKGTIYSLRIFPLGGFVDIDDEKREGTFANAPLYQKNLILLAGVTVNLIFALVLAFIVLFAQGNFISNVIDTTIEGTNISQVGIKQGDIITKVNDKKIKSKTQIDSIMSLSKGENLKVEILRDNEKKVYDIIPYANQYLVTGFSITEQNVVNNIAHNLSSKIKINDKITKVNGIEVVNNEELVNELYKYIDDIANITVLRENEEMNFDISIKAENKYYLGITLQKVPNTFFNKAYYAVIGAGDFLYETFKGLWQLITGKNNNAELMGIIGVSEIIVKTSNWIQYFGIMASVSLSLAIVNLFPLPLLDGGKIVLFTIEKYRKKEFSEKFSEYVNGITMAALILLTVYVMIKDIIKII